MRKRLLPSLAALLLAATASAQGIVHVGANIPVLPSSRWSNEVYRAKTLVINPGVNYGEENTANPFFNQLLGAPADDASGKQWFEPGYDETTLTENVYGDEPLVWEEHSSPFSSDKEWGGNPSYQWTTNGVMADLYIRRPFTTDKLLSGDVYLACGHDDSPCEYYINGVLVFRRTGYEVSRWDYTKDEETGEIIDSTAVYVNGWNNDEVVKLTDEQKKLINLGGEENLMAVHVHQNWGGAFADCGLYTLVEGGLEMGYVKPWDGKVIFNNKGGYGNDNRQWSPLYEAKEGDVYTLHLDNASPAEFNGETFMGSKVEFKTPLNTVEGHEYLFKVNMKSSCDFSDVTVMITQNDNDDVVALSELVMLSAGEDGNPYEGSFSGEALNNVRITINFAGGEDNATVELSEMSLYDETDGKELWTGTSYFNDFHMTKINVNEDTGEEEVQEVKWPEMEGRTESLAWTQADFDDGMWDTWAMPVGNEGYMPEVQTIWPGGDNTNLWVRRTFEMDKINERLSYALNVCHDDTYETYVNGHLLQKNTGWTDGKNPVQVHIPASYLNVGKNVIATYIQQNWGGKFYDCGINVEEVNYDECAEELMAAIALGEAAYPNLTAAMKRALADLVKEGKAELENNKDAAEVKEYAKNLTNDINVYVNLNNGVLRDLRSTIDLYKRENKGTYTDRFNAAVAGLDTCLTGDEVNKVLTDVRVARKKNAAERRTEKFVGCEPDPYVSYYVLNVGDKRFLGGAEAWGAHAATEYECIPIELVTEKTDGSPLEKGFRIHTFRNNGGDLEYLNYGGFVDCSTDDAWELIPVEGKKNVYNIARLSEEYEETVKDSEGNDSIAVRHSNTREDGTRYYLGLRDGDNALGVGFNQWNVVDTDNKTASLETNQWMFITEEERLAMLSDAAAENPVDASFLLPNPGYDQRVSIDEWICVSVGGGVGVWGRNNDYVDFVYEAWNTESYDLSTTLYDLKPGAYKLSVQGYYRDGHYSTHLRKYVQGADINRFAHLYVLPEGGYREAAEEVCTETLCSFSDGINMVPGMGRLDDFTENYTDADGETKVYKGPGVNRAPDACWSAAEEYFQNGLYWNELYFEVPATSTEVVVGVYKEDASRNEGDWVVVDNWRLTYYGDDPTAIGSVADGPAAPAKDGGIYNLSGQKLQKAQKGVNIVNGRKFVVK